MRVHKTWKRIVQKSVVREKPVAQKETKSPAVTALVTPAGPPEESEFDNNPWLGIRWKTEEAP